ncbi:aminopeptidase P N-terminal domain-containing protein [Membranicola marinus]|uniref:Xaa-Pro aminopeptidase n=1 Tax=Membranihabitans marinus TaxID=1227546 RepID=A0A953LAC7_9BACT|nr:aminopeptidase P family protein [Membranihabitans marinus]MBY5957461.1 aminopeptidase P N-terminal domain-containing protein [Membranihabitans marinus]
MFVNTVYKNRRRILKHRVDHGMIWLQGNQEVGMNYTGNPFPYRQDSNFLYYTGVEAQGMHLIIDIEEDKEYLVGDDLTVDETIWVGDLPDMEAHAEIAGIANILSLEKLPGILKKALLGGRQIHTLPLYHGYQETLQRELIGPDQETSESLIRTIVGQRSIKEDRELREMEDALRTTAELHHMIMKNCNEGVSEQELYARGMEIVLKNGCRLAYNAIVTIQGQTLHINTYQNQLRKGKMLLCDMGAENAMHYCADITRTTPVNRKFNAQQKAIYEIVLDALKKSTAMVRPGEEFKDIHLFAAREMTKGLVELGLMMGDPDEIVEEGAHALFFPHGLGHMVGMDVHDMEGLGEKFVGYDPVTQRSEKFGTSNLRLGRKLEENFVITIEPGLYFIPNLIELWKSENKFKDFIAYNKLGEWMDFGGVRIEDNVRVTDHGSEILNPLIAKEIHEIESM